MSNLPGHPDQTFSNPPKSEEEVVPWIKNFLVALVRAFDKHKHRFPESLAGELRVSVYATAQKPTAADAGKGAVVFVSDGGAGAVFQGSDGTNWVNLG